jgi:hypothetical protein
MQHFPFGFNTNTVINNYTNAVIARIKAAGNYTINTQELNNFLNIYKNNGGIPNLLLNAKLSVNHNATQSSTYNLGTSAAVLDSAFILGNSATMTENLNNKVYKLDATTNQYIETNNTTLINCDSFTFSIFFKINDTTQRTLFVADVFAPRIAYNSNQAVELYWNTTLASSAALTFAPNIWHSVTIVSDGTSYFIYKNGNLLTSAATSTLGVTNNQRIAIGKVSGSAANFSGNIDNITYYNTGLTQQQILNIYNQQKSRFGL